MTDLQINVALAKAMGWVKYDGRNLNTAFKMEDGYFYCWFDWYWREFSYLDPVIFVAICKHWMLDVCFSGVVFPEYEAKSFRAESIEKSAALCVIDLAKRGIK